MTGVQQTNMRNGYRIFLHLIGILSFSWSFYILSTVNNPKITRSFGSHYIFLTILGLLLSLIAFVIALLVDLTGEIKGLKSLSEFLLVIGIALESVITVLYWSISLYDRELLKHPDMPEIPFLFDLSLHLFPAVFIWIDFLVFSKNFIRQNRHILFIYIVAFCYGSWAHFCYLKNGFWAYPFLGQMSGTQRSIFYFFGATIAAAVYELGAFIHLRINGSPSLIKKQL
ncbi:uncharacterized protein VTP21DRAFT_5085 [Calcarisporiella thermophila]|uniref:uncharacterized protein n=1 Tax=Calcarisporiella thermophila TaxID=911321 RepID=UPI00374465D1